MTNVLKSAVCLAMVIAITACSQSKQVCVGGLLYHEDRDGVYVRDDWQQATCVTEKEVKTND